MASRNSRRGTQSKKGWVLRKNQGYFSPVRKPVDPKTLSPFEGINQIKVLQKMLVTQLVRANKVPVTKPNFLEISIVVCKIIFATPVTEMRQVEDCCFLIERHIRSADAKGDDFIVTLGPVFMQKLRERFTYKKRLQDLLIGRQIPWEKKEEWLQRQYEVYGRLFKETDARIITFLKKLYYKTPSLVYDVLQYLVEERDDKETLYFFMETLLKAINIRGVGGFDTKIRNEVMERFQKVKTLGDESSSVPQRIKMLLQEHWNSHFESGNQVPVVNPLQNRLPWRPLVPRMRR